MRLFGMNKVGSAVLPLHEGHAPPWLFQRMKSLGAEIVAVVVNEFGRDELLRRLSNPFWFQSLGCVLGYDWHSSGVTTVLTAVLREVVDPSAAGIAVCGGKGRRSTLSPNEIHQYGSFFHLSDQQIQQLEYASRLAAKVDNAAIQAGYPLYHHSFIMTVDGKWSIVQQGMSATDRTARRYHWLSEHVRSFVNEPHEAIVGNHVRQMVLDMTSRESEECRSISLDLVKEGVSRVKDDLSYLLPHHQRALTEWMPEFKDRTHAQQILSMPRKMNWDAVRRAYELQPGNYEELLGMKGIGPGAVRALALISQIIYGAKTSWRDPVKYSFAVGGKDGVPFPVDRRSYDETIQFMQSLIQHAKLEGGDKYRALEKLKRLTTVRLLSQVS